MRVAFSFPLLIALFLSAPLCARAEDAPIPPQTPPRTLEQKLPARMKERSDDKILTISYENDKIGGGGTDRHYTNGVRISMFDPGADVPQIIHDIAGRIPTVDINETTSITWSIGQNLYTPEHITRRAPDPDDRPWAAFLYGSAGLTTITDNHVDEVELTLGIVGPEAMGEPVQKAVHKAMHVDMPKGWSNQLKTEPGVILSAQRRWPGVVDAQLGGMTLFGGPYAGASVGNIYTYGNAGGMVTLSPEKVRWQDAPVRVRPSIPGTGYFMIPDDGFGWSLFAGVEGRAVARNIFLDGNTFTDSPSIDKKPLVADATAGVSVTVGHARLSYSTVWRSKEFDGQDKPDLFGVMNLGVRF